MKKRKDEYIFSKETVTALAELGEVLRSIVIELVDEGKATIVNGKVVFIEEPTNEK